MTNLQQRARTAFNNAKQPIAQNVERSLDCYETKKNNNMMIMGPPGSNKSRGVIIPSILQGVGSMVVSDPKGSLYKKYGPYLESKGYKVMELSLVDPEKSIHYNPISEKFLKKSSDIRKLANTMIYTKPDGVSAASTSDPFWDQTATTALSMVIAYVMESDSFSPEEKNLNTVNKILSSIKVGEEDISGSEFARKIERHHDLFERHGKHSFAYTEYKKFVQTPHRTMCTVITTIHAAIAAYDTEEIMSLLSSNDIDFEQIGNELTAIFVSVSDTDRSLDPLASVFFSQLFQQLCLYADRCKDQMLPIPTRIVMDDFATNVRIPKFDCILSNIRSRAISAVIVCQSEAQLVKQYDIAAKTIMDDCDTTIIMGANSVESAEQLAKRANIPVHKALEMAVGTCYIFEHGEKPKLAKSIDLDEYIAKNNIVLNPKKYTKNKNGGRL